MTDTESLPPAADTWQSMLDALRRRFPGQRDSVLFCIHKLQQNPDLSLRDFRDEARLHGIPVAGRSLHSARVLLGLQKAQPRAAAQPEAEADAPPPARRGRGRAPASTSASIEDQVVTALRRLQTDASAEAERLRKALRQAVAILQQALDD